jgi:threonine/homoserine/homoserine lactone efflux protein
LKPLKILSMSFVTGLSGALMPGPVLAITISSVIQMGFIAVIMIMIGHSILELGIVIALALGLKNVLKNKYVTGFIGVIGGLVMLWFSYGMIKSAYLGISAPQATSAVQSTTITGLDLILKGLVTSASNPYWIIWWATIGATYMLVSLEGNFISISSFYIGHISSDFVWYCAVALALVLGKQVFSDKVYMVLIILCGVFLIYMGIYFFISGIKKLRKKVNEQAVTE